MYLLNNSLYYKQATTWCTKYYNNLDYIISSGYYIGFFIFGGGGYFRLQVQVIKGIEDLFEQLSPVDVPFFFKRN